MKKIKTLTLLLATLLATNICAQTVTLDPTFGENGMTVIPNSKNFIFLDFDKSGNIISSGISDDREVKITKINYDGIIDKNFGTNGEIILNSGYAISNLKVTTDNKILLSGTFREEADTYIRLLLRFNEDGTFDNTFGDDGKMNLDLIAGVHNETSISCVNLENDDFMLIAMTEYVNPGQLPYKSFISKYNYDGILDESFGENGKVLLFDDETFRIVPRAIKILNDLSIVIAGHDNLKHPGDRKLAFCKLSSTGVFITDFANNGIWIDDNSCESYFYFILEDTNGNLLFAGVEEGIIHNHFIYCFYPNGIINSDFGSNGYYEPFGFLQSGRMQLLQNESKYLVRNSYYKLIRIHNNGTFDMDFNIEELWNTSIFISVMQLQKPSKLIIGYRYNGIFYITRLNVPPPVSVKEQDNSFATQVIFPNPATDQLYFKKESKFEIMDIQGRILLKSEKFVQSVNVCQLESGTYFIKFEDNRVEKFIKK